MWTKFAAVIVGLTGFTIVVQSHTDMSKKDDIIVGSHAIDIAGVPYFVNVEISTSSKQCGGVIISESWIVTAAHCATEMPRHYRVRAGSSSRNKGGYPYPVDLIEVHPDYQNQQGIPINDIALMHVAVPIDFQRNRGVIQMFGKNDLIPLDVRGSVISWSEDRYKIDSTTSHSQQLYYIPIVALSIDKCRSYYWDRTHIAERGQLCIAYGGLTPNICDGDSGAALVINEKLAGLYSWGCEDSKQLGVYTEIAYYRSWIESITGV